MSNTSENFLVVTSNDRNTDSFPLVCNYRIDLDKKFKNIKQVQLVHAIIPNAGNVLNEPYLLLKIEEFRNSLYSNNMHISECFQILPILSPTSGGDFIHIDTRKYQESTVYFVPSPKASLGRISISITDSTGAFFDFGAPSGDTSKTFENTFILKVITEEKKF